MSTRLLIVLVLAGIAAGGVGVTVWIGLESEPLVPEAKSTPPAADADPLERREKFFGSDPDRNVRGGQEMKPRW